MIKIYKIGLSIALLLGFFHQTLADTIPATVTVGTGVLIPMTDIRLNNDSITINELANEIAESKDQNSSDSITIDSNIDAMIQKLIPDISLDTIPLGQEFSQTFHPDISINEFEKLIEGMDADVRGEYERWIEKANIEMKNDWVQAAEELIEFVQKSKAEAERLKSKDDGNVGIQYGGNFEELLSQLGMTEEELIDLMNRVIQNGTDGMEKIIESELLSQKDFIIECLKNNAYDILQFQEMEESYYRDDEFVYSRESNDYTDIMYRCSICGNIYSYEEICDCGKVIYSEYYRKDHRDAFDHFTDYGGGVACNSRDDSAVNQCIYCQKPMNMENMKEFLIQENGYWACWNCYYNEGASEYQLDGYSGEVPASESMRADFLIHVRSVSISGNQNHIDTFLPEPSTDNVNCEFTKEDLEHLREFLEQIQNVEYPENLQEWDSDVFEDFQSEIFDMISKIEGEVQSGDELLNQLLKEAAGNGFTQIQETEEYQNAVNKIFGGWPVDRELWSEEMKGLYDEFVQKYSENSQLQSVLDSDFFHEAFNYNKFLQELNQMIAGHTSITENISTSLVFEISNSQTHKIGEGRSIMGYMKAWVVDVSTGITVWGPVEDIDGSIPLVWPTTYTGSFAIRRTIDTYYVTAEYITYDLHLKWIINGTNLPPIYEKTIHKIRQDVSGTNERNRKTNQVNDVIVKVIEGSLRVDTTEDYATERIM